MKQCDDNEKMETSGVYKRKVMKGSKKAKMAMMAKKFGKGKEKK